MIARLRGHREGPRPEQDVGRYGGSTRLARAALGASSSPTAAPSGSGLAVVAAVTVTVVARGGTAPSSQLLVAAVLLAGTVAALARSRTGSAAGRHTAVVAAAALAGWSLVRAGAAGDVAPGLGTAAVIAGAAATYFLVASEPPPARALITDVLLGMGAVLAASGWIGVALRWEPLAIPAAGLWRAATLLTYANAAAAVLAMLSLVALARLATRPSLAGSWVAMLLLTGLATTLSRAGVLALAAGLVVLAYLLGAARLAGALLAPGAGATVAFVATLPAVGQSTPPQPALALAGLAAAAILTGLLAQRCSASVRALLVVGSAAMVAVLAAGIATGGLSGRLSPIPADRIERNRAALEMLTTAPLVGVGPGPLWVTWEDAAGRTLGGWHVHNEYLELVVELGLVGGALLGALLIAVGLQLRRGRPPSRSPAAWAGVVAALTALALHSAFDFLWHVPAIPLLAAALLGTADHIEEGATT